MRSLKHRRRIWTVLPAVVILTSLTAASCDESPDVTTAPVSRAAVTEVVDAPASVTARAAATLTAPADGTLAKLSVRAGDQVRKGQVLAVVDSPAARRQLRQAKKALAATKRSGGTGTSIDLKTAARQLDTAARESFDRARAAAEHIVDPQLKASLLAQIETSQTQYAQTAHSLDAAVNAVQRGLASLSSAMRALSQAQQLQAQQAYDLTKSTVDALTLKAPIAGVVQLGGASNAAGPADLSSLLSAGGLSGGGPVSAGQPQLPGVAAAPAVGAPVSAGTAILTVVDVSELGVVAEVDETDILLVRPGVQAQVELGAAPGVDYPALVGAIDVLPTPNGRGAVAYRVHLTLRSPAAGDAPEPRPGMSAVARLTVREATGALTVPVAAVFSAEGQDMVWVRRADGTAERRPVRVGVAGAELLEVVEGLAEGEAVVVRGVDLVHEGDELR